MSQIGSSTSVPALNEAALPAAVRNGSTERKDAYKQALGFERVLLGQMTETLMKTTGGSEGSSAAIKQMKDSLPGLLADALTASGGIGLAQQMDAQWNEPTKKTSLSDIAGTSAGGAAGTTTAGDDAAADGTGGVTA